MKLSINITIYITHNIFDSLKPAMTSRAVGAEMCASSCSVSFSFSIMMNIDFHVDPTSTLEAKSFRLIKLERLTESRQKLVSFAFSMWRDVRKASKLSVICETWERNSARASHKSRNLSGSMHIAAGWDWKLKSTERLSGSRNNCSLNRWTVHKKVSSDCANFKHNQSAASH